MKGHEGMMIGSASSLDMQLPRSLQAERHGDIAILSLARAHKRNALDDATVSGLEAFFAWLSAGVKAVVVAGAGDHFCAGLDFSELIERDAAEAIAHSRSWHRAFERIEFGKVPVVAVLHGAVTGSGLELAAACHIRVAESSSYYALPEAGRGIFVGGGGSVRLPRLIGTARMMDMMLTGRTFDAEEGQAIGISNYLVPPGTGLAKGMELARYMAGNAPLTNFAVTQALPRIAQSDPASGYLMEALTTAMADADEAKEPGRTFLDKRSQMTALL
jgi:enoyl-CoA hydratase/carnithine racemase